MLMSWAMAKGSLFNVYGLFMLAAMPFHGGYALLYVLHAHQQSSLLNDVSPAVLGYSMALVLVCMALLHTGALAGLIRPRNPEKLKDRDDETKLDVYRVGWLLLAFSVVPEAFHIREAMTVVIESGYIGLFQGGTLAGEAGSTLMGLMAAFFLPGVMFLLAGSRDRPLGRWISLMAIVAYAGAQLFLGYRAYALLPLVAYTWLWHYVIRPLPIVRLTLVGIGGFLFLAPFIRHVRGLNGVDRLSPTTLWQTFSAVEHPVRGLVVELSGTLATVAYTIIEVGATRPFEAGLGYVHALGNAVPIVNVTDAYGSASSWLAWRFRPEWAVDGFGFGYSFIAEAYLNFGWIGAPVVMLILGYLLVRMTQWAQQKNIVARMAMVASLLPAVLFFVRGESVNIARPILWYALIPYIMLLILKAAQNRFPVLPISIFIKRINRSLVPRTTEEGMR